MPPCWRRAQLPRRLIQRAKLRVVLRYAEDATQFDSAKLKNLGWKGSRRHAGESPPTLDSPTP